MTTAPAKRSGVDRFLAIIERAGNALPHPATLFAILALLVIGNTAWVLARKRRPAIAEA